MISIGVKELLDAGVHFGHQTKRWNPKMKPFIFQERNGIYIIDLALTVQKLRETYEVVKQLVHKHCGHDLVPQELRAKVLIRIQQVQAELRVTQGTVE